MFYSAAARHFTFNYRSVSRAIKSVTLKDYKGFDLQTFSFITHLHTADYACVATAKFYTVNVKVVAPDPVTTSSLKEQNTNLL
jgi:hypothetical protein